MGITRKDCQAYGIGKNFEMVQGSETSQRAGYWEAKGLEP